MNFRAKLINGFVTCACTLFIFFNINNQSSVNPWLSRTVGDEFISLFFEDEEDFELLLLFDFLSVLKQQTLHVNHELLLIA